MAGHSFGRTPEPQSCSCPRPRTCQSAAVIQVDAYAFTGFMAEAPNCWLWAADAQTWLRSRRGLRNGVSRVRRSKSGSDGIVITGDDRRDRQMKTAAQAVMENSQAARVCPACRDVASGVVMERFGRYECFACGCGLHFWNPREMPDARWYERVYGGRDVKLLPLEPGHKYFLSDPAAPTRRQAAGRRLRHGKFSGGGAQGGLRRAWHGIR